MSAEEEHALRVGLRQPQVPGQRRDGQEAIPLFLRRGQDDLLVFSKEDDLVTQPGDTLVVFMPPIPRELEPHDQASFEHTSKSS